MTTSRLAKSSGDAGGFRSSMRALEWAAIAQSKNLPALVKLWEKADREGWDDRHYCPIKAEELANKRRR